MVPQSVSNGIRTYWSRLKDNKTQSKKAWRGWLTFLRVVALAPVLAYLILTAGYLFLGLIDWSPFRLHDVAHSFIHLWLMLSLPLVLIAVALRGWKLTAAMAVPGALFWLWFGALFLPQPIPTCDGCTEFTVMTTNTSPIAAPEEVVAGIRESNADVVVIQELFTTQAALIEQELSGIYPYQALYPDFGLAGAGLISKYPISNPQYFDLVVGTFPYVMADVDINGRTLTVIGAHPPPPSVIPYGSRLEPDIPDLHRLIAENDDNVILLGDFNTTDRHSDYRELRSYGLSEAWRSVGSGFGLTFPIQGRYVGLPVPPLIRIDHVFYTDKFIALQAVHGPDTGGDHRPVMARIAWPEE